MQSTPLMANPLAPHRATQMTTHTVTETAVTGPPQYQSQTSYQQYAQPAAPQKPTQYFQQAAQGASQYLQQGTTGLSQYIQQPSQGATQYIQQASQGATQYLQQASQGASQYLQQQTSQGATQYLQQQPSQGATQYLQQQPSQGATQYLQQSTQVASSPGVPQIVRQAAPSHPGTQFALQSGGQYIQATTDYTQIPTTHVSGLQPSTTYAQYRESNLGTPSVQYRIGGGSSQGYGQSQLPTITQAGASILQDAPDGHKFVKSTKGPGSSAFVSGPVPDATPMVTSGTTGTIIPRQQPYAFTTVTYAKTKASAKEEVDPNFKNSYLNAHAESHALRARPVHPMPAKAPAAGCC